MQFVQKIEDESRKGLNFILAEIAESEGNYNEAAEFWTREATMQAYNGDAKGVSAHVRQLLNRANENRALALAEMSYIESDNDSSTFLDGE